MSSFRVRSAALLVITLLGAALLALPSSTASANPGTKTVYFTMSGTPQVHPKEIFLTADAGPYLKHLSWSHWGSHMAMAEGVYVSDCASCLPPKHRSGDGHVLPADQLWPPRPGLLEGRGHGQRADHGHHNRVFHLHMGCAPE